MRIHTKYTVTEPDQLHYNMKRGMWKVEDLLQVFSHDAEHQFTVSAICLRTRCSICWLPAKKCGGRNLLRVVQAKRAEIAAQHGIIDVDESFWKYDCDKGIGTGVGARIGA